MIRLRNLLIVIPFATPVWAHSLPATAPAGSRTFCVGPDASPLGRLENWLWLNGRGRVSDMIRTDPIFSNLSLMIDAFDPGNRSASYVWDPASPPNLDSYPFDGPIADQFLIPGFRAKTNRRDLKGSVLISPATDHPDFSVSCALDSPRTSILLCELNAAYPPDPLIYLQARVGPDGWSDHSRKFPALVAKMRAIAACLDVTGRPFDTGNVEAALAATCLTKAGIGVSPQTPAPISSWPKYSSSFRPPNPRFRAKLLNPTP